MGLAHPPAPDYEPDPMAKRETLELVRAYYKITDPAVRKRIFELTKSIAKSYRARRGLINTASASNSC